MKEGQLSVKIRESSDALVKLLSQPTNHRDQDLVERISISLHGFLRAVRFIYPFITHDYDRVSAFTKILDRCSLPMDFQDKSRIKHTRARLIHLFGAHLDPELSQTLKSFSKVEIFRLDEAIITLRTEAYLSSIVMSVSAAEGRLHKIVKKRLPRPYKKDGLEKAPLGTLLNRINTDKKYKKIKEFMSIKFPSLLAMCNHYRIFSAHPKEEVMSYQDALAILGLVLSFLLDPKSK